MSRPRRPAGLRREVAILVPTCLVLLVALSTYTLFSYRAAVERLVEERRSEALRVARVLAGELAVRPAAPEASDLARLRAGLVGVERLEVLDAAGAPVAATGPADAPAPLPWTEEGAAAGDPFAAVGAGLAVGPGDGRPATVAAYVPFAVAGARHLLRADLPAAELAARRREVRVLTPVVVGIDVAVGLLVLFFLRHLMAPYEALLAEARRVGGEGASGDDEDEVAFLVRTYESGLAALARSRAGGVDDDIAALERMLGGSLESGLLLLDREGRVVALNPVGERLLEVPAPAPGTPLDEALAARPELAGLLAAALAEETAVQRREVELAAGGERRVLGVSVHPLRGAAAARGFLVLFADLTEVRRQADEARLADGLVRLGELAAGVAHELRNGLATLRGYLALAERTPAETASFVGEMRREADHLQRVLEDFLSFARPGSVRLEEVRAGALLARAAADPALAGAAVRVDDGGLGDTVLRGDPTLLERALRNLLHNAVEAQEARDGARPAVEARLRRSGEHLEIVVEDRGAGVPPELAGRLFDPFVTGRPGGIGLGLALTHRIVDLHGGAVRLEPREGGGTRAVVRLPA